MTGRRAEQAGPDVVRARALRPRFAASILLLDRSLDTAGTPRVLMGRRSSRHVFMPNVHVFPGGRRDPDDHRIGFHRDLAPTVTERIIAAAAGSLSRSGARALALAALRELYEETGLQLGEPGAGALPFKPDLSALRLIARAITPPGHPRRFDTYFFAAFADETPLDPSRFSDSGELEDVRWVAIDNPACVVMHEITARILDTLRARLDADPALGFEGAVSFFHTRHGRFISDIL